MSSVLPRLGIQDPDQDRSCVHVRYALLCQIPHHLRAKFQYCQKFPRLRNALCWMVVTKKKGKRQPPTMAMLDLIVAKEQQSVNVVTEDDEWEEVKLAVDSGRRRTSTRCPVQRRCGERGCQWRPNPQPGREWAFRSHSRRINEVCGNTGRRCQSWLLSVRKITRSGNRVVFDNEGSYIEN